eukprot:jgi/Chrzof1/4100/UNPLg00761.t1
MDIYTEQPLTTVELEPPPVPEAPHEAHTEWQTAVLRAYYNVRKTAKTTHRDTAIQEARKARDYKRQQYQKRPARMHKQLFNPTFHNSSKRLQAVKDKDGTLQTSPDGALEAVYSHFKDLMREVGPPRHGQYGDNDSYRKYPWERPGAPDTYDLRAAQEQVNTEAATWTITLQTTNCSTNSWGTSAASRLLAQTEYLMNSYNMPQKYSSKPFTNSTL